MADQDNGFDTMMDIWQQSQDAFMKAQVQVAEQFRTAMGSGDCVADNGANDGIAPDPMAAWQAFLRSWSPAMDMASQSTKPFAADMKGGPEIFFAMLDPQKWTQYAPEQLRIMLDSIASGPQFADLVMPQQKAAEAWRESLDYQQAASDMSKVMQEAWTTAYETFSKKYTLEDLKSGNVNEALDAWLKAANVALLEAQGSKAFLDAQKRMIRASTEIRARQRDMAEEWSEVWQIPTRTEVDDLAHMVHQLRREIRALKRELAKLKEENS